MLLAVLIMFISYFTFQVSLLCHICSDKLPDLAPNMINCDEAIVPQAADNVPRENLSRAASKSAGMCSLPADISFLVLIALLYCVSLSM